MQINSSDKYEYHWGWAALLMGVVLVTLAVRYALPIRDGDIWWHMLYGQYFLENRTLIADHTIFSWSPTTNDSIYCTWLPDILFYLIHKWVGLPGLFAFRYICLFSIILGGGLYAKKISIIKHPLSWLIILVALLMSYTAAFVKPEVISFALMTLTVWNWYHIRSGGEESWKYCYLFPVIMLIWVNSHGAYVFGVIFLILIALGELLNTWFSHGQTLSANSRRHFVIALFLCAITPFVNPYGYHYVVQLFFDLLPTADNMAYNNKIAAYSPTFVGKTQFQNFQLYADVAIAILLLQYGRNFRRKQIEWSSLLTNLVFAYLYTKFFRTTFYFAPVFAFSGMYLLSSSSPVKIKKFPRLLDFKAPIIAMCAVILAGYGVYIGYKTPEYYVWNGFGVSEMNPVSETAYLEKYFPKAKIGNTYDQGAYLLWALWPDTKVFFDSRHFPYRAWSDELFVDFQAGGNISGFLEKYQPDIWLVGLRMSTPLTFLNQSADWQRAFYGKNSMVFVRKGIELPKNAPLVSADIGDLKNPYNAYAIFTTACNVQDWPTTDILIKAMGDKFNLKLMLDWAYKFRDGVRYYYDRDYQNALNLFVQMPFGRNETKSVEATCHQLLAAQAWQQREVDKALGHVVQAWNREQGNIYSAYNAGLINWYKDKVLKEDVFDENAGGPLWGVYLTFFLENASRQDKDFAESIAIAEAILNDATIVDLENLTLLLPPEPIKN